MQTKVCIFLFHINDIFKLLLCLVLCYQLGAGRGAGGGSSEVALMVKNSPANAGRYETQVRSLGQEDPLEEAMATHSSILAWRIPWTEEPGGLQSIVSHRV